MTTKLPIAIRAVIIGAFVTAIFALITDSARTHGALNSCNFDLSKEQSANKVCSDKLRANVDSKGEVQSFTSTSSFDDFKRDWAYSLDFYIPPGTQWLCPKEKGGKNFQRIFYKKAITPQNTTLKLKFRMHDEKYSDYIQQFVIGLEENGKVFTELDIPTRYDEKAKTMSMRGLISQPPGKSLVSNIKDGTPVNLEYVIQNQIGSIISQTVLLSFTSIYGQETDKYPTFDKEIDDSNPNNLPMRLFVGSYMGGCIEIIDWSLY